MNKKKDGRGHLLIQLIECIRSPSSAFRSLSDESSIRDSILLVLTIAIIASLASYNYVGKITRGQTIIFPIMTLIGVFGKWLISSSFLYVFSRVQGGKSSLRNMLILVGFASTPFLIQHILRLIDSFTTSPEQVLQLIIKSQIFENKFLNSALHSALDKLNVFWVWSLSLQVISLKENYEMSRNRSIITVIVTFIMMLFVSTFFPF